MGTFCFIENIDVGPTFRVVVGVGWVGHHGDRERNNKVLRAVGVAARAKARGIVRHVASVGFGEGGQNGECDRFQFHGDYG